MREKQSKKLVSVKTHITMREEWPILLGSFVNPRYEYRAICHEAGVMTWEYFSKLSEAEAWCNSRHQTLA